MCSRNAFLTVQRGLRNEKGKGRGQSNEDSWAKCWWVLVAFDLPFISGCCVLSLEVWVSWLLVVLGPSLLSNSFLLFLVLPYFPHSYYPGLSLKLISQCQCLLRMHCWGWAEPHPETGAPRPCPALPHPTLPLFLRCSSACSPRASGNKFHFDCGTSGSGITQDHPRPQSKVSWPWGRWEERWWRCDQSRSYNCSPHGSLLCKELALTGPGWFPRA